jgi:rhodanese-related sulfurtransferase
MTAESLQETLSAEDARQMIASSEARVLDIRDQEEWEESRIAGAKHLAEEEAAERLDDFPEDTAIVVVCADGKRSGELAAKLRETGKEAASIDGGMKAWVGEDLPVQPRADQEFEGPDYTGAGPGASSGEKREEEESEEEEADDADS